MRRAWMLLADALIPANFDQAIILVFDPRFLIEAEINWLNTDGPTWVK